MIDSEIRELLVNAVSPSDKAYLLILLTIQQNLVSLNSAFLEHRDEFASHRIEFTAHVVEEQQLINRGMGAWLVMTVVLAFVVSVGGWYISHHIIDTAENTRTVVDLNSNRITALETLIRELSSRSK